MGNNNTAIKLNKKKIQKHTNIREKNNDFYLIAHLATEITHTNETYKNITESRIQLLLLFLFITQSSTGA